MAGLGGDDGGGKLGGNVQAVTEAGESQIFLGVLANVIDKAVKGIVGGVDGPDNFVEGAGGIAGGLGNLPGVSLGFGGVMLVRLDHFAKEGQLGQAGADLVVDVASDAGALVFQGLLLAGGG